MSRDGDDRFEIEFEPVSRSFDPGDDRWIEQKNQLLDDLRRDAGQVRTQHGSPEAGAKGDVASIILALGSAGAITAAVQVFRAWLSRDRNRSLVFTSTIDGKTETREITVNNVSEKTFRELILPRTT